jgi:signal peptidase I
MDAGEHAEGKRKSSLRGIISLVIMVAIVFGISFLLREFVIQGYKIPSGSMETTIMTDDTVFSEKVSFWFRDVEAGDIVTFNDPEIEGRVLIKRVIATGGQTIDLRDGVVYVDGEALSEPYTQQLPSYPLTNSVENITYPYTIAVGSIWVMGDNRTNSQDSRYFGAIKTEEVRGRGFFTYWPLNHLGILE